MHCHCRKQNADLEEPWFDPAKGILRQISDSRGGAWLAVVLEIKGDFVEIWQIYHQFSLGIGQIYRRDIHHRLQGMMSICKLLVLEVDHL